MAQTKEIAIQPGQPADLDAAGFLRAHLQPLFLAFDDMVMPHIWWIADQ